MVKGWERKEEKNHSEEKCSEKNKALTFFPRAFFPSPTPAQSDPPPPKPPKNKAQAS